MENCNCQYHEDHSNRIEALENSFEKVNERLTSLDKEHAVSRTEITSSLKSLEKLPETMVKISETMVSIQGEITKSNERISRMETTVTNLNSKISQVDEEGKFNIRIWIKNNWIGLSIGLIALLYLAAEASNIRY